MTDKDSMYVVKFGNSYKYTIPGFSVITVQLRHAKIQKIYNGELKLFDVFFNEEVTIGMHLPTGVVPTDSCYIEADKFALQIQLSEMQLVNDAVLIIWKWKRSQNPEYEGDIEGDGDDDEDGFNGNEDGIESDEDCIEDDEGDEDDIEEDEDFSEDLTGGIPCIPHTIVFKCIGATKDAQSQAALCAARDRMSNGWTVAVRMRPEPTNIVDSQAIMFECELDGKWKKIGYVVRNILSEVHTVMGANLITSVQFKCVKYVTHWSKSGPGYYAGISVTKNGPWDNKVKLFQSTLL